MIFQYAMKKSHQISHDFPFVPMISDEISPCLRMKPSAAPDALAGALGKPSTWFNLGWPQGGAPVS